MSFASTSRRAFRVPLRTRLPLGSFVVGWRAARTTCEEPASGSAANLISTQKTDEFRGALLGRLRRPAAEGPPLFRACLERHHDAHGRRVLQREVREAPRVERLEDRGADVVLGRAVVDARVDAPARGPLEQRRELPRQ